MSELLKGPNGRTSSKRVAGFIGLIVFGTISVYAVYKDPSIIAQVIWPWAIFVGGMFGVTVLEKKL